MFTRFIRLKCKIDEDLKKKKSIFGVKLLLWNGRHDIQHNDTQYNDILPKIIWQNITQFNEGPNNVTQQNPDRHIDTQNNYTQHGNSQRNDIQ